METTLTLKLTGTRDMLLHNGRLENPLDPHTRAIAAIAKKRNKTDKDYAELASLEARGHADDRAPELAVAGQQRRRASAPRQPHTRVRVHLDGHAQLLAERALLDLGRHDLALEGDASGSGRKKP